MAVASRGKALSLFQKLIYDEPLAAENILADPYLPAGLAPSQDRVGMDPATLIGGYGREERYMLHAADAETAARSCWPSGRRTVRPPIDPPAQCGGVRQKQPRPHHGRRHHLRCRLPTRNL